MANFQFNDFVCLCAAQTALVHVKREAGRNIQCPEQLAAIIDSIKNELDVLSVIRDRWTQLNSQQPPIMEETTQQKGDAK